MPYEVVQPPKDDEELKVKGYELIKLSADLGRAVDIEGFVQSWLGGVRVIIERDDNNTPTGIVYLALGRRWLFQDTTASILYINVKDTEKTLDFIKTLCNAMGADVLYMQDEEPISETPKEKAYKVREIRLR